jgi:Tol biopolymer transport system component
VFRGESTRPSDHDSNLLQRLSSGKETPFALTKQGGNTMYRTLSLIVFALVLSSAAASAADTRLISRASQKKESNGISGEPATTQTGQFVAFRSSATNLDSDRCDDGLNQIYVSDPNGGTIRCVSVNSNGKEGDQDSFAPSISADGRFIAFTSRATNLAGDDCDNGLNQIHVHDRTTGTTHCVSINSNGHDANQDSNASSISADGRWIAFDSAATNLSGDKCDNGFHHIFVRDRTSDKIICASVRTNGDDGNGDSFDPSISADGRFVVFHSTATNLSTRCDNGNSHIFRHDLDTGETICVSVNTEGEQGDGNSFLARVSADGRFVAFQSNPTNVTARCSNGFTHIYVRDTVEQRTTCASVDKNGNQGNNDSGQPSISSDGRFVAFSSAASNLGNKHCQSGKVQVLIRDRANETTSCASVGPKKVDGNGQSINPALAADGTLVVFESEASNLVKKDTNNLRDVFGHANSTSKSKNEGSSFFFFFDLTQTDGFTGGISISFD